MKISKALVSFLFVIVIFYLFDSPIGQLPSPGKFFSPFSGFWQNNTGHDRIIKDFELPGLKEEVTIYWDERRIPHIFAKNDHDLYMSQGYVLAKDRLWQMEFQTLAAAGRLSEFIGRRALGLDRYNRRLGMVYGAENSLVGMMEDAETRAALEAFADGVNAWISTLNAKSIPLEYKILDYYPEEWNPLKSSLLLKYMSWTLTGLLRDKSMSITRAALGEDAMTKLFPLYPVFPDPIIPEGTTWDFETSIPDKPPETFNPTVSSGIVLDDEPDYVKGSNNWAISGSKTSTGYPMLANDPHLNLTLPSIWYEIQLISPNVNAYGVTIPGMPGITIGFNKDIAWGVTNGGSDVLDWYEIKFTDDDYNEYQYEGKLRKTEKRIEEIKIKNEKSFLDTVVYTHHGPVVYKKSEDAFNDAIPKDSAMRWTAHDKSNELKTFFELNRGKDYNDYKKAMSFYDTPSQNFVFADINGDIAITHNGKFPARWSTQGRYILDGSDSAYEWGDWIPKDQLPATRNPERGFVSSANQVPAAPDYPYYLGWWYESHVRGTRINQVLSGIDKAVSMDLMNLQLDNVNLQAEKALPLLLNHLDNTSLNASEIKAKDLLEDWNYQYEKTLIAPSLYDKWQNEVIARTWYDDMQSDQGRLRIPSTDVTIALMINEPENPFFDDKNTPAKENFKEIAISAFRETVKQLSSEFGSSMDNWLWGSVKKTTINHVARIPGLGMQNISASGRRGVVNATGRTHGPSVRIVVELGTQPKAWFVYPGGQSGNPGSSFYANMIDDWLNGRQHQVSFFDEQYKGDLDTASKTKLKPSK